MQGGELANYIPELTKADPSWFSICLVTMDGAVYSTGDSAQKFTIQSISKPFVYATALADRGVKGNPATDTVTDFDAAPFGSGGDVLDLRDALSNESHTAGSTGNLSSFLHFEQSGSDTVVRISTTGGFSGGYVPNQEDHTILLQGVDLIGGFSTDQQVIQDMLNKGKLITD